MHKNTKHTQTDGGTPSAPCTGERMVYKMETAAKVKKADIKKVVLAYSGGLDTSIIIPWLKEN